MTSSCPTRNWTHTQAYTTFHSVDSDRLDIYVENINSQSFDHV